MPDDTVVPLFRPSTRTAAPMSPEQLHRILERPLGSIHDQFCRCRTCKPALAQQIERTRLLELAIIGVLIVVAAALVLR